MSKTLQLITGPTVKLILAVVLMLCLACQGNETEPGARSAPQTETPAPAPEAQVFGSTAPTPQGVPVTIRPNKDTGGPETGTVATPVEKTGPIEKQTEDGPESGIVIPVITPGMRPEEAMPSNAAEAPLDNEASSELNADNVLEQIQAAMADLNSGHMEMEILGKVNLPTDSWEDQKSLDILVWTPEFDVTLDGDFLAPDSGHFKIRAQIMGIITETEFMTVSGETYVKDAAGAPWRMMERPTFPNARRSNPYGTPYGNLTALPGAEGNLKDIITKTEVEIIDLNGEKLYHLSGKITPAKLASLELFPLSQQPGMPIIEFTGGEAAYWAGVEDLLIRTEEINLISVITAPPKGAEVGPLDIQVNISMRLTGHNKTVDINSDVICVLGGIPFPLNGNNLSRRSA